MCGRKERRVFRVSLGILLILSVIQVMPFDGPFVENASGGSSWMQTTEADFLSGTPENITITPDGNVTLELQTKYIEDDFTDESMIDYSRNVVMDTSKGEVRLNKINKTFGGSSSDGGNSVRQTSDGGYIIAGYTSSYGAGGYDIWLIKTDSFGVESWNKTYGGSLSEIGYCVQQTSEGEYIIVGYTISYSAGASDFWLIKTDSLGAESWNKSFGGSSEDEGHYVQQTSDGGYIIAGYTSSYGAGGSDVWLIKTDSSGNEQWNKTFGGSSTDKGYSVHQISGGGYIIAGYTHSYGTGSADVWLIKTDSSGAESWNNTFGGIGYDHGNSVQPTSDGGYIIAGSTNSYGIGSVDAWLIKANSSGSETWNKTFGGSFLDESYSVQQTSDGGYIIGGNTKSWGAGKDDAWLIKTDSSGGEKWFKFFGGSTYDYCKSVRQTSDGGYIISGYTESFSAGGYDVWLIKTDSPDVENWNNIFEGSQYDGSRCVQQTSDGGYIIAATTYSYGINTPSQSNVWLIKTDSSGKEQWNKTFGGSDGDSSYSIQQTVDGGYIITGYTKSYGGSDIDVWLIKTNSSGSEQWNKTFGGDSADYGESVLQTFDGGYIIAGHTLSFGINTPFKSNTWLIKTDSLGIETWNNTFGGIEYDRGYSVQQTSDRGYIIAGHTYSYGAGNEDAWLIKTDSSGIETWNKTFGGSDYETSYSVQQTSDGGYITAGYTGSFGTGNDDVWLIKTDSSGAESWNNTFGGSQNDVGRCVQQTANDGYIIIGSTRSYGINTPSKSNILLIRTDSTGAEQWNKIFGGNENDFGYYVQQTLDGGYILVGRTYSYGVGTPSNPNIWLIKTNSEDVASWSRPFGGSSSDEGVSVLQTSDGGYIIAGYTESYGAGGYDAWLIKTDSSGSETWNKTFGGSNHDFGASIEQTADGGYIIAGNTQSYGVGLRDAWLIKIDSSGTESWNKTFGGNIHDFGNFVQQTSDGGYIIAGYTESYGAGGYNTWLIKTDSSGNETWNKTFGGSSDDWGNSVWQTSDGGYIIAGITYSYGAGIADAWLIKTDSSGTESWNKTFGGSDIDSGYSVHQISDGGYIIGGNTQSYGAGKYDAWLIKTDSSGNEQWNKTFGGSSQDYCESVLQTSDGGFIITGSTISYGTGGYNAWLIKTDSFGSEKWFKILGGSESDTGRSVHQTSDSGYIIAGYTNSYGIGVPSLPNIWLVKDDSSWGEIISTNLFMGDVAYAINNFTIEVVKPLGTSIKVQFSRNALSWYNSTGSLNGWDNLFSSTNVINFKQLGWNGSQFYYRVNFASDGIDTPILKNIIFSYQQYKPSGIFESESYDTGGSVSWWTLNWSATKPPGTEIKLQLRTASTQGGLLAKNFVGSDGTSSTNYTIPGSNIWPGHDGDQWIQYKVYLYTTNTSVSPILHNITIHFNLIPNEPTLTAPPNNLITINNTPSFDWTFFDLDGYQTDFEVLIDDDSAFDSVNYDSGEQSSTNPYWQFPSGTGYTTIADGIYYWKVRVKDNDGDWSPYSNYWNITIDITPPNSFTPLATPDGWTNNNQPQISFFTIDATSGIDYYQVKIDSGSFTTQMSPYTLPEQSDGTHNITVRAYDKAGNYRDGFVDVYIDATLPNDFIPTADPSGWTYNSQPTISFSTTDTLSGIDHYEVSIDGGGYSIQTSPYTLPAQSDGVHNITVRAIDLAGNYVEGYVEVYIDTTDPVDFNPTAPSGWIADNQPEISFSTTDVTSGIDHYEVRINDGTFATQTSPYTLPAQSDGTYNITVRAYDRAGNYIDRYVDVHIDTTSPLIIHTPITAGNEGSAITISATVTDDHSGVDYVELFYKKIIDTKFSNITMMRNGNIYSANIPADTVTVDGVDYYLKAADKSSEPSIVYYGAGGQVSEEPNSQNDIVITISDVDITPPTIIEKFPEGNNVPVSSLISVTFSEAMDKTITDNIFTITPELTGTAHWEGNKLIFNSEYAMEYGTPYSVTVGTVVKDIAGNNLENAFTWQFITTSIQDVSPPTIGEETPRGVDISIDTTISLQFSERMQEDNTKKAFSIEPYVDGKFTWEYNKLVFTPDSSLSYETTYTITISTDAKDFVGNNLENEYSWSFTTEEDPEKGEESFWETWEPIITGATVLASIIVFLIGFLTVRKKRSKLRQYMDRIESTFNEYKQNPQECEKELIELREDIKADVRKGKIEENHFLILDKRIDDYLLDLKTMEKEEAGEVLEEDMTEPISEEEEDISGGFE
ncbi:MAG: Ig-like domain-containing protein [Thermoplasmata archaeon]|nr:MAG: Ig-like domain-containing protein [Thermoplasmata archaeon]